MEARNALYTNYKKYQSLIQSGKTAKARQFFEPDLCHPGHHLTKLVFDRAMLCFVCKLCCLRACMMIAKVRSEASLG
eukprot:4531588-Amphidinium_carterae.2